ncbi:MAG TPA: acyl carrier protein [Campylobacterales bacterium]|nr:acyl carrier protein [Campylobacterales bacterium]
MPMNEEEILIKLKKILMDEFEVDEEKITPNASFYEDLELDSLDAIDLIVTMNNVYNIDVDNKSMEEILTIQQLIDTVKRYITK